MINVGRRHVARFEPLSGLAQLLLQHLDVAALQIEDGRVAQQVHIGHGRVEQHGLFGRAQRLARGTNLAFGLPGPIGGLEPIEEILRQRRSKASWCVPPDCVVSGSDASGRIGAFLVTTLLVCAERFAVAETRGR